MSAPRIALLVLASLASCPAPAQVIDLVSGPADPFGFGQQPNGGVERPALSADGRYVVFESEADNLVPNDRNRRSDVFVRDRTSGALTIVSRRGDGSAIDGDSFGAALSADGRFVAFMTDGEDVVPGDGNNRTDLFVHDRTTGSTERVSVSSAGTGGDFGSFDPDLSADGRYVAFQSFATNLVAGDTNGKGDVFVRDRVAGTTERVSFAADGSPGDGGDADISADGRYVCFGTRTTLIPGDTNGTDDVYLRDRTAATTVLVSRTPGGTAGNNSSFTCSISADGGAVAFASKANDLVAADTNANGDVFVWTRATGAVERVSLTAAGGQTTGANSNEASISDDGTVVVFNSASEDLPGPHTGQVDVYVRDRVAQTTTRVTLRAADGGPPTGSSDQAVLSGNGRFVAFLTSAADLVPGDTNGAREVFLRDRVAGAYERVGMAVALLPSGAGGSRASLSADGRWVAFETEAHLHGGNSTPGQQVGHVYLYDSRDRELVLVSRAPDGAPGNSVSYAPRVSDDGRYVAYVSYSTNLTTDPDNGTTFDAFLFDRVAGTTRKLSKTPDGSPANGNVGFVAISGDGSRVAFVALSSNLVPGDTVPGVRLVAWSRTTGALTRADVAADGTLPSAAPATDALALSRDGRYLVFASPATNLGVDGATGNDVFRKDLVNGAVVLVNRAMDGGATNAPATSPAMSADGRFVAYRSAASNIVPGDTNNLSDVHLADLAGGPAKLATPGIPPGSPLASGLSVSADGRYVAYDTEAGTLVAGDGNDSSDVFVFDAQTGAVARASTYAGAEYAANSRQASLAAEGDFLVFDVDPSIVAIPDRYNASTGPDVLKARNPFSGFLFRDGLED